MAALPEPVYRVGREIRKLRYVAWSSRSRLFEAEMNVGRLLTPPVRDVVTGAMIAAGPDIDDAEKLGQPIGGHIRTAAMQPNAFSPDVTCAITGCAIRHRPGPKTKWAP